MKKLTIIVFLAGVFLWSTSAADATENSHEGHSEKATSFSTEEELDHSEMTQEEHEEEMDHSTMSNEEHENSKTEVDVETNHEDTHGNEANKEESHSENSSDGDSHSGGHGSGGEVIEKPANMKVLGTFGAINLSFILIGVWNKWLRRKEEE